MQISPPNLVLVTTLQPKSAAVRERYERYVIMPDYCLPAADNKYVRLGLQADFISFIPCLNKLCGSSRINSLDV